MDLKVHLNNNSTACGLSYTFGWSFQRLGYQSHSLADEGLLYRISANYSFGKFTIVWARI